MKSFTANYNKAQLGYTLIELMIVIAIISILAATAISTYHDYIVRTRASEAVVAGAAVKKIVTQNIADNGGAMPTNACTGFSDIKTATKNVVSIECNATTGVITIFTTAKAGATTFIWTPTTTLNGVYWVCSSNIAKYAPKNCR